MDPQLRGQIATDRLQGLVGALEGGLSTVYVVMAAMSFAGLCVAMLFPRGSAESHAHADAVSGQPGG